MLQAATRQTATFKLRELEHMNYQENEAWEQKLTGGPIGVTGYETLFH
jgi:hypothetical protein